MILQINKEKIHLRKSNNRMIDKNRMIKSILRIVTKFDKNIISVDIKINTTINCRFYHYHFVKLSFCE